MSQAAPRIAENLAHIRQRIAAAAERSGRNARDVTLVAVTKYVGTDEAAALIEAGCFDLGESRPQELWRKAEALQGEPIRWHMIGHLQRNKARQTLPLCSLIHAGASWRLLETLDRLAGELSLRSNVLLEVNISGEAAKHGFVPDELEPLLPQIAELSNLQVRGLMAMAGREGGTDRARGDFSRLRELRDQLQTVAPDNLRLEELSMGMSGDFEVAIEEGATLVRVGSALFEGVDR